MDILKAFNSVNLAAKCWNTHTHTTILRPFFREHPGEPVPEENSWTLWCKGRLTEADTLAIRLGATLSGPTSAHLHHPPCGNSMFKCWSSRFQFSICSLLKIWCLLTGWVENFVCWVWLCSSCCYYTRRTIFQPRVFYVYIWVSLSHICQASVICLHETLKLRHWKYKQLLI